MFTPVLTIVVFAAVAAAKGSSLDTATAFTTVAIISLVTHPVNMVMTIIPRAVASLACFERIQAYLLEPTTEDQRVEEGTPAARLSDVTITNTQSKQVILRDLNFALLQGSVVICSGAVGCGKSSLARAILGEAVLARGTISVASKRIAFCSQIPWLPNRSIRDCIYGLDARVARVPERLDIALRACCLDEDLRELPNGADTLVGSRGLNLSGGQRQRVVGLFQLSPLECDADWPSAGTCTGRLFGS